MNDTLQYRSKSFSVIIGFVVLIIIGIPLTYLLNFEINPIMKHQIVVIRFSWISTEPKIIEEKVTSKLEAIISQLQGISNIKSKSAIGTGEIIVETDNDINQDAIRFQISSLIRQIWPELPIGVTYPQVSNYQINQDELRPVLSYTLSSNDNSSLVQSYAEDNILPLLSQIEGISKVEVSGGSNYGWIIEYNNNKIELYDINEDIIKRSVTIALRKENLGLGMYLTSSQSDTTLSSSGSRGNFYSLPITLSSNISDDKPIEDVNKLLFIPIKQVNGRIIYLKDIASIKLSEEIPSSYFRINGLNTINIRVFTEPSQNNLRISNKAKHKIQNIQSNLPIGYRLNLSDDSTQYIEQELNDIALRSLFSIVILLLFILVITRRWEFAILVLTMLIGNLAIAVIFYYFLKVELHLYAIGGITVSLGLMTDNIIIMSDHLFTRGNKKAFLGILAGTLATISAMGLVFVLDDKIKSNLIDFAKIIIVNQLVSLITALFVIPALMDKMNLKHDNYSISNKKTVYLTFLSNPHNRKFKWLIKFNGNYLKLLDYLSKHRINVTLILILCFGIPIYMLPRKLEGENWIVRSYNKTIGSEWYYSNLKPYVDKAFGGSLRLFTEGVYHGSFMSTAEESFLLVTTTMPHGTTLSQADDVIKKMESFLKQFKDISSFQSTVTNLHSMIKVYFNPYSKRSEFPSRLKEQIINKAVELGGSYWTVQGFGEAFNNNLFETTGNYSIKLSGYNLERLNMLASGLKSRLSLNNRVKEIYILSERSWFKPNNIEYYASINKEKIINEHISIPNPFGALQEWSLKQNPFTSVYNGKQLQNLSLKSDMIDKIDLWKLLRYPIYKDTGIYKLINILNVSKNISSSIISKENQQYLLYLQFEFIGAEKSAQSFIEKTIRDFSSQIPIGYSSSIVPDSRINWTMQNNNPYWLLLLIVIQIFFLCTLLFESLIKPIAVIILIPISYIGVFLTFYIFGINFDLGGFASLVLISGITVNAGMYILNDYNNLINNKTLIHNNPLKLYLKAFNFKIRPILIIVFSSILGFVPFLIGIRETFWYTLAIGTIGGLLSSLIGIFLFLPLYINFKKHNT